MQGAPEKARRRLTYRKSSRFPGATQQSTIFEDASFGKIEKGNAKHAFTFSIFQELDLFKMKCNISADNMFPITLPVGRSIL